MSGTSIKRIISSGKEYIGRAYNKAACAANSFFKPSASGKDSFERTLKKV